MSDTFATSRTPPVVAVTDGPRGAWRVVLVLALGAGIGLFATWSAVTGGTGFGVVAAGAWEASPRTGALDADPYTRAVVARRGLVPLGLGEGIAFVARRDDSGAPLVASCDYRVAGMVPQARVWTLSAQDPEGRPLANPVGRHGMTSAEVVRDAAGAVQVAVSREARAGNWLPLGEMPHFALVLRLYDTAVSGSGSVLEAAALPRIERERCG